MKPLSSIAPLAALFLLSDPFAAVLAEQRHVTKYQPGFTEEAACYRYEYREEYVPGNSQSKGYVKSHRDKVEVSCGNSNEVGNSDHNYNQQQARNNDVHLAHHGQQPQVINVYPARPVQQAAQVPQGDTNDCRSGTVLGAIAGGAGAFGLTNGGRYSNDHLWSVPLGMVAGSMAGCQLNGG
jgi:hypothetical protein